MHRGQDQDKPIRGIVHPSDGGEASTGGVGTAALAFALVQNIPATDAPAVECKT